MVDNNVGSKSLTTRRDLWLDNDDLPTL